MPFPVPNIPPNPDTQPPAAVRIMTREDVRWHRPVFKAPPLELHPEAFDATRFARDLRRIGLVDRE